jgi:hypothetical protein
VATGGGGSQRWGRGRSDTLAEGDHFPEDQLRKFVRENDYKRVTDLRGVKIEVERKILFAPAEQ